MNPGKGKAMSENVILFAFEILTTALGSVSMVLIGCVVWEIRQLRRELKECVPDAYCKVMMSAHEKRLDALEKQR